MLKLTTIILFIYFPLISSFAQENGFSKHFPQAVFDTLHVHVNLAHQNGTIKIPFELGDKLTDMEYYPISSFYLNKNKKYKAYLLASEKKATQKRYVYIIVLSNNKNEVIYNQEIASYTRLESAYEEWQNAWIADFNDDGNLDIGIYKRLIDFELPTKESNNSSGDESYLLVFKNGQFKHRKWNFNVLKYYQIKP